MRYMSYMYSKYICHSAQNLLLISSDMRQNSGLRSVFRTLYLLLLITT